jgi:nucleoside-diphosphate-sugar epimerase
MLGQSPESDNQIWHAPSAPAITGKQFIELAADVFGVEPRYGQINKFMLWMAGLFNKVIMGTVEMYYQYDHDYVFDSTKFEKAFNVQPTLYRDGIQHLAQTQFKR